MEFSIINKALVLCAKRNSGKSVLLKYIVSENKKEFDKIFVICPTEKINKFYSEDDFVDKNCIFEEYSEDWVTTLMNKLSVKNEGLKSNDTEDRKKAYKVLLILDDCCSDTNFHHSKSLKQLFTKGRHYFISLIITAQYPYNISPVCRQNCDFILCGQINEAGIDLLANEYRRNLTTKEFIKMYEKNTIDYGFLLINNNSTKSKNLDEIYGNIKTPINNI